MKQRSHQILVEPVSRLVILLFVVLVLSSCQSNRQATDHNIPGIEAERLAPPRLSPLVYIDIPGIEAPEFSGCMSSKEDSSFWVASDENKDVIWEISISGEYKSEFRWDDKAHDDIEGLALDGAGGFFMITSQSLSGGGASKKTRNKLTHFKDLNFGDGDRRTVARFRDTLIKSFEWAPEALSEKSKEGGIDVEGVAYDASNDRMWIGFRGPLRVSNTDVASAQAVVIQLDHVLRDWDPEDRTPPLEFSWAADSPYLISLLGQGVRDLFYGGNNQLYILTGLLGSNPPDDHPAGNLWRFNTLSEELVFIRTIPQVADSKDNAPGWAAAEGICTTTVAGRKQLMVVYDSAHSGIFQLLDTWLEHTE